jgi:tRNA-dihydrouridine synthase 3
MGKTAQPKENDDDAAEGRTDSRNAVPLRAPQAEQQDQAAATVDSPAPAEGPAAPASEGTEEQPAHKKVRLSGAQKKALARAKKEEEWQARQAAKSAAKAAGGDAAVGGEGDDGAGGKKKGGKGQNKVNSRTFLLLGAEI